MSRTGKIARLPREVREALNLRLLDGEAGGSLLRWLNARPDVRAVLDRDFAGRPVSPQNLSEWRHGGYREWLARREVFARAQDLAADADHLTVATGGCLADRLAAVVTARYADALSRWDTGAAAEFHRQMRALRGFCQDVVELRRGDHSAARLRFEHERLDRARTRTAEELVRQFERWLEHPAVRACLGPDGAAAAASSAAVRQLFGLPGVPPASPSPPAGSNQIKPNQTGFPPAGSDSGPCP